MTVELTNTQKYLSKRSRLSFFLSVQAVDQSYSLLLTLLFNLFLFAED